MTDIMEQWRNQRYVVCDYDDHSVVVLTDITYWTQHYDSLVEWCDLNDCDPVGLTVDIPSPELLTAFALRWA